MATVVNVNEISKRFQTLGWADLSRAEVLGWMKDNAVSGPEMVAYLDAAVASPAGFNDQTIAGCSAAQATKITGALKSKSAVVT